MSAMPPRDAATVRVLVEVEPAVAFQVFTEETDLWWRKGFAYRPSGRTPGTLMFEPVLGGRLFETFDSGTGPRVAEMGRITAWDPPARLAFDWRASNFAPGEVTHVEVVFAPAETGTWVTLRHWGWSSLRADHPVRHGEDDRGTIRMMGLWWGALLTSFRERFPAA